MNGTPAQPDPAAAYLSEVRQRWGTADKATWHDYATALELLAVSLRSLADIPRLLGAVEAVRSLHKPFGIYDECGHNHTEDDLVRESAIDANLYFTCKDGLLYQVCTECCTAGMDQTEDCVSGHEHGPGLPFCRTVDAITKALLGETDE